MCKSCGLRIIPQLTTIGSFQARPQALRWLVGKPDGHLQESYRELLVNLGGDPQAESVVHSLRFCDYVH